MNKEELLNKIINYNYTNFGNEFGDYLVDIKNENQELKDRIDKAVEYIEENELNGNKISEMLCGSEIVALLEILKGDKE